MVLRGPLSRIRWVSPAQNRTTTPPFHPTTITPPPAQPAYGESYSQTSSQDLQTLLACLDHDVRPESLRYTFPGMVQARWDPSLLSAGVQGLEIPRSSHPLNLDMLPCHQNLAGLDWRFSRDSVTAFKTTLQHSPVPKYVTINLSASVTTIGLDFEGRPLDSWIRDRLGTTSSLTNLVAMTSGSAYNALAKLVTAVDLRLSPLYTNKDKLTHRLALLPSRNTESTSTYSGIFYSPPSLLDSEDRYEQVSKVSLKTSGSSRAIKERWNAFLSRLRFIPVYASSPSTPRTFDASIFVTIFATGDRDKNFRRLSDRLRSEE